MERNYSKERNVQILVSLLKANGIKKVVASPGTANMTFVLSIQFDPDFEIYSAPDERSAAYMACGMAAESGGPVVITCTGATASRNYLPGLTEAWYRRLPILAVTGTLGREFTGTLHPQVIDRTQAPNDTYCCNVLANSIKTSEDEWTCNLAINKALIELRRQRQPVLIDLQTKPGTEFGVKELPPTRIIRSYGRGEELPELPKGKIILFIGSHPAWSEAEFQIVDQFCKERGAIVIGDHTSNYPGLHGLTPSLVAFQRYSHSEMFKCDLMIHLGSICGDYYIAGKMQPQQVWRVCEDGQIRDEFRKQTAVFQMSETEFFSHYTTNGEQKNIDVLTPEYQNLMNQLPELPFSNIWMASQLGYKLPENAVLHLGILNSLRSMNFFKIPESVNVYSNVGGFGIDGCLSTLMGAALASPEKIFFCVVGDLAWFYDMNALGNRHFPKNIRIILVNNGKGVEFTNFTHPASWFGAEAEKFVAAGGHYEAKNIDLVKHYSEDLGFDYHRVTSKEEFTAELGALVAPEAGERPMMVEAIVRSEDESTALQLLQNIQQPTDKDKVKDVIKDVIGEKAFKTIVNVIKK